MSQALRKITGALDQSRTTAVFIDQLREKIGVMFGSPEIATGGRALTFHASVRLDIRRIETLKDGPENGRGPVSDCSETGPDLRLSPVGTTGFEPATP